MQHLNHNQSHIFLKEHLAPQVLAIYSQKHKLDAINQQTLDTPAETILQLPNGTIRDWLKRTGSFVRQGLRRAQHRLKTGNHNIAKFFRPISPMYNSQEANLRAADPIPM
jgi:hypothetical protein